MPFITQENRQMEVTPGVALPFVVLVPVACCPCHSEGGGKPRPFSPPKTGEKHDTVIKIMEFEDLPTEHPCPCCLGSLSLLPLASWPILAQKRCPGEGNHCCLFSYFWSIGHAWGPNGPKAPPEGFWDSPNLTSLGFFMNFYPLFA